jgi:hypothetical protein
MEDQIKQLIEIAKQNNDTALVQKLTEALELVKQEQNTQEAKKEVVENSKAEDEDIKKVITGEVSKLIIPKTNKSILESKYMDMSVKSKNPNLRIDLESVLFSLALDDVNKEKNATTKLYKILDTYKKPEDINDIQVFLNDIAKIGHVGLETKESIADNYENNRKKEIHDSYFDDEYDEKKKNADLLEMELEELSSKSNKNPNDYEELIDRYNFLIQRLEELYDETYNKVSSEKSQKLEETIQQLKKKVIDIRKYLTSLKEAIDETNRLFEY